MEPVAGNQQSDSLTSFESLSIIVLLIIIVLMVVVVIIIVVFLLLLFRSRGEIVKWKEDILETNGASDDSDEKGEPAVAKEPQDEFCVIHVETAFDTDLDIDVNKSEKDDGETEMEKLNGDDHNDATTTNTDLGMDEFKKAVLVSSEDKAEKESTVDETESPKMKTSLSENPPTIVVVEVEPVLAKEKVEDSGREAKTTAADASITATTGGEAKLENQAKNTEEMPPSEDKSPKDDSKEDVKT